MPELPEVEEVRRTLEPALLGRTIVAVGAFRRDFVAPQGVSLNPLVGRRFVGTLRHGKKLFCTLDDSQTLLFHLGMTGRLACAPAQTDILPHTHFTLRLGDGHELRFRDPRRFGGVWYYATLREALATEVSGRMGPDALTITADELGAAWSTAGHGSKGALKARLLGQRDVAGLGNIYVDESLWLARLHPLQRVGRIPAPKVRELVRAMQRVLQRSIASGGTTLRDYRNAIDEAGAFKTQLKVYGRGGEPCRRCRSVLRVITAAGRTTVFCPECQKRR